MHPTHHPTALRTAALLSAAGVNAQIVEFDTPTHTSAEAAAAIGCQVAQIAKSVVFRGAKSDQVIIVVTSGANRVSESKLAALIGEKPARADADFVRNNTGYAIGGVAPLGYPQPVIMLLDQDLLQFDTIWAAAGTPYTVFALTPDQLTVLAGNHWVDVAV